MSKNKSINFCFLNRKPPYQNKVIFFIVPSRCDFVMVDERTNVENGVTQQIDDEQVNAEESDKEQCLEDEYEALVTPLIGSD